MEMLNATYPSLVQTFTSTGNHMVHVQLLSDGVWQLAIPHDASWSDVVSATTGTVFANTNLSAPNVFSEDVDDTTFIYFLEKPHE